MRELRSENAICFATNIHTHTHTRDLQVPEAGHVGECVWWNRCDRIMRKLPALISFPRDHCKHAKKLAIGIRET